MSAHNGNSDNHNLNVVHTDRKKSHSRFEKYSLGCLHTY